MIVRYVADSGSAYEAWRRFYFTAEELADPLLTGDDADRDHDGMSNLAEYLAGTNPTNDTSLLVLYQVVPDPAVPGQYVVYWQSATGRMYTVEGATNLVGTNFDLILGTNIPATPMLNVYTDTVTGAAQKFYRIKLE